MFFSTLKVEEAPFFECEKCGACCKNLLKQGGTMGLMLYQNEISLFSKEYIKPCMAVGKRPSHKSFTILTYQLTENNCPHLNNNKCSIYDIRPSQCRGYPLKYIEPIPEQYHFEMDPECTALKQLRKTYGENVEVMFYPEKEATVLLSRRNEIIDFSRRYYKHKKWFYDLRNNKWRRYRRHSSRKADD